jgi:hypothetical protein
MDAEILEKVAALLADGMGEADNLDVLEQQLTRDLRQLGQRALQKKLEGKKGATGAAAFPARAGRRPDSSATGNEPS